MLKLESMKKMTGTVSLQKFLVILALYSFQKKIGGSSEFEPGTQTTPTQVRYQLSYTRTKV